MMKEEEFRNYTELGRENARQMRALQREQRLSTYRFGNTDYIFDGYDLYQVQEECMTNTAVLLPYPADYEGILQITGEFHSLRVMSIEKYDGNREKVAADLGISKTTLWRHIKKYGIEKDFSF